MHRKGNLNSITKLNNSYIFKKFYFFHGLLICTHLLLSEKLTQGYLFCCVLQKENYEVKKEKF